MFIHQTDLFRGMNKDFVKQVFDLAVKESIADKDVLFSEGDQAKHFYILLKGRVKLSTGETGQVVHTVSRPGEAFGSIPVGIFLCYLTISTGNIWAAIAVHSLMALSNEWFSIRNNPELKIVVKKGNRVIGK